MFRPDKAAGIIRLFDVSNHCPNPLCQRWRCWSSSLLVLHTLYLSCDVFQTAQCFVQCDYLVFLDNKVDDCTENQQRKTLCFSACIDFLSLVTARPYCSSASSHRRYAPIRVLSLHNNSVLVSQGFIAASRYTNRMPTGAVYKGTRYTAAAKKKNNSKLALLL